MPIQKDVRKAIEQLRLERDWSKAEVARQSALIKVCRKVFSP